MTFDGIVTKSIVHELKNKLLNGRIDKIYQPEKDELRFNIYNNKNYKLLISANSSHSRIHLTDTQKENPASPPMFCMLLRKYLAGGRILNIEQYHTDRIIFIDVSNYDELGNERVIRLIVEIMGRHSNIILIEKDSKKIIDSIFKVTDDISRVRQILPGLKYEFPPLQNKYSLKEFSKDEFLDHLDNFDSTYSLEKFFYSTYLGLSPLISREICFRSYLDSNLKIAELSSDNKDKLYKEFINITNDILNNNYKPNYYIKENNKILDFYCLELKQYSLYENIYNESMSYIIDNSYNKKDDYDRLIQKSNNIRKVVTTHLDREAHKLNKQGRELGKSIDREKYKVYADILSANFYRIPKGATEVELENFYDENMSMIKIPLNEKYSAPLNADKYYKMYSKLKNAEQILRKQIPITKMEISYLENVLMNIDYAETSSEIDEIKSELIKEGYIKKSKQNSKNKNSKSSAPYQFLSSDGYNIYVGRNNRQNDELSLKFANKEDYWLHVQNMPGSHVIIRMHTSEELPETTLLEAASLAAFYSKARNSSNVAVDYTFKKNIKKAKGAKPGMVFYEDFKTVFVDPDVNFIKTIKKVD